MLGMALDKLDDISDDITTTRETLEAKIDQVAINMHILLDVHPKRAYKIEKNQGVHLGHFLVTCPDRRGKSDTIGHGLREAGRLGHMDLERVAALEAMSHISSLREIRSYRDSASLGVITDSDIASECLQLIPCMVDNL
ncbi:hypothetical protein NDU88_005603 [Pleurodeles waltl]|uniref:Uncharacterized protein n=1 Tax=Pleurodeles waltl TaxID=8319 RepID=A0AAV7PGE7_PLEWA|nr:hypothetical protein NDU88_005603 [Pleurodeles waltl]